MATSTKEERAEIRVLLHGYIRKERTVLRRGAPFLPCPACDGNCIGGFDMHEALINRAPVELARQHLIFIPWNVVQLHHHCHMEGQGAQWLLDKCLLYLIKAEGAEKVAAGFIDVAGQVGISIGSPPVDGQWEKYLFERFRISRK
jgi:hypothetical protein